MLCFLGDLDARARGLRTRLLGRAELDRLARAPDLFSLQQELGALGIAEPSGPASAIGLERSVRRQASAQLALLERWSRGPRRAVLAVVFEDEDRRSIQALLRGADEAAAPEARLAGLVPTERLPERALQTLAQQPTLQDLVRMLLLWNHPLAGSMAAAASQSPPSLFRVELELQRAFAATALRHADRGGRQLRAYAEQAVDLMNAWAALLHFPEREPALAELTFIEGGRLLSRQDFDTMMRLESAALLPPYLAKLFAPSPLSAVFADATLELSQLETRVLRTQIEVQRRAMRHDPLGAAPIIAFALELRAQVIDLRRIIWGVELQAPKVLLYEQRVLA